MTNLFSQAEQTLWNTIHKAAGSPTAVYRVQNSEPPSEPQPEGCEIKVVPETPQPDGFAFEDFRLYKTSRVFKVGKLELNGLLPKEGDTLTYNDTVYTVKRTQSGPCYEEIGNYNVMLRVHGSISRS
jgi:hypothetical protein